MLCELTPEELTLLGLAISLWIFENYTNNEANAINNLLAIITSNLSVQLAQLSLNDEVSEKNNGVDDNTPLFTI